jgi:hypothetical protein
MSDVLLGGLIGLGGVILGFALNAGWEWWRSDRGEEEQLASVRQLVAQEVDLNYRRLLRFVATLMKQRHTFAALAPYVEEVLGPPPTWERARWDSAPILIARAFKQDELLRIGRWYARLDDTGQQIARVTGQSRLLRDANAAYVPSLIAPEYVEAQLEEILKAAVTTLYERRPYVNPDVEAIRKARDEKAASGDSGPQVDDEPPPVLQFNGEKWVPIPAETLLSVTAKPSD